jgi:hypothetical protein
MRATFVIIPVLCLLTVLSATPASAKKVVTLYLDGAVVAQEAGTKKGYLEILLPPGSRVDSLRIKPGAGTNIVRVVTVPLPPSRKLEKELAFIVEREELLQDRLKALATREEIFKAAAKSQSAKAPRKTKANPEPLKAIRQGTDYAIAQLEAVYQSRRRTEKELKQLEDKRRLATGGQVGGTVVKVWLGASSGVVTVHYLQPDRHWIPSYELRAFSEGKAKLSIFPRAVAALPEETIRLVPAPLDCRNISESWVFVAANRALSVKELAAAVKTAPDAVFSPLSLLLTNSTGTALPSGDLACYLDGEYLGTGKFPGLEAAKSLNFDCRTQ